MKISALDSAKFNQIKLPVITGAASIASTLAGYKILNKQEKNTQLNNEAFRNNFIASQNVTKTDTVSKIKDFGINPNAKLYVLSGSSGVGKDTILRAFLEKHPEYKLSVSHTTRPIRPNEKDGIDYYFVSEDEFDEGVKNGEFLEWANFSGNKYGTKKQSVEEALKASDKLILKLDTIGALKVKKMFPQAVLIFIAPPSVNELEARLRKRNTESEEAIQKRLSIIKSEIENSKQFDYKIVNDTIENAVSKMEKILC